MGGQGWKQNKSESFYKIACLTKNQAKGQTRAKETKVLFICFRGTPFPADGRPRQRGNPCSKEPDEPALRTKSEAGRATPCPLRAFFWTLKSLQTRLQKRRAQQPAPFPGSPGRFPENTGCEKAASVVSFMVIARRNAARKGKTDTREMCQKAHILPTLAG